MDNQQSSDGLTQSRSVIYGVSLAVVVGLLWILSPILTPFLLGGLIAYLGHPMVDRFERKGLGRVSGVMLVFLLAILAILGLMLSILPQFVAELGILLQKVPLMLEWMTDQLTARWAKWFGSTDPISFDLQALGSAVSDWGRLQSVLATGVKELLASGAAVLGALATLALTPVVAFYALRDWPVLIHQLERFVPPPSKPKVQSLITECDSVLSGFFRGQLMVMIALSIIYSVGLSVVGLKGSLAIGVVAGLFSVVPYLGTVVGLLIGVLAAVYQFQDVIHPVLVLSIFLVGQLAEGMVLTPWFVGDRIGLHPVAVIFALMAGGQLFGFVGVLIALPVAAVLVVAIRHLVLDQLTFAPAPGAVEMMSTDDVQNSGTPEAVDTQAET